MGFALNVLVSAVAIAISAYILPGVTVDNFFTAIIVALVLGVLNAILKPILVILTLPINIITLGLFTLVINAVMILIVDALISGFSVENFWWALLFSVVLSVVNSVLHMFTK